MGYAFALLLGEMTVVFAYCTSVPTLALLHAAAGFAMWLYRIVIDERILQIGSNASAGRSRVYISVMLSFVAMIMCFSPTIFKLFSTGNYFLCWGIMVVISSLLLWARQLGKPRSRLDPNKNAEQETHPLREG